MPAPLPVRKAQMFGTGIPQPAGGRSPQPYSEKDLIGGPADPTLTLPALGVMEAETELRSRVSGRFDMGPLDPS